MRKYPEDFINKIICGDCLEVMTEIPASVADAVVTDVPFEAPVDGSVFEQISRIMKEDSWFIFWFPEKYLPHYTNVCGEYLTYVWTITHHRYNSGRFCPIGFSKKEQLLVYKKGKPKMQKKIEDIMVYPNMILEKKIGHPFAKPYEIVKFWLDRFTWEGDIVIDPFLGSGTVAAAGKSLARNFIGIEINPDYCKIAEERLV